MSVTRTRYGKEPIVRIPRFGAVGLISMLVPFSLASSAQAQSVCPNAPESSGVTVISNTDPLFGPIFTADKGFAVWADTNCGNPMPVPGSFTYVYTIGNRPDSLVGLVQFEIAVPPNSTVNAGALPGTGVNPSSVTIDPARVVFAFSEPGQINPGQSSQPLFIVSPFGPGEAATNMVELDGQFLFNQNGTCVGPVIAPPALPCTIGFWKNRQAGKKGLLKFFPNGDFDSAKAKAVAISSVFSSEVELVSALTSKGSRSVEQRAKQQLSALLLNVAAGNLFPSNTKCRLFLGVNGTLLDLDGDGLADQPVEAALVGIESDILSGNPTLQGAAQALADDINNGIGVIGATQFN